MSVPILLENIALTATISLPTALEGAINRPRPTEVYDARLDWWSRKLLEAADISLSVSGRENLLANEAFVVMSNHQSHYDIPVLFQALGRRIRMVAKTELFKIPVFASAMRAAGFVEVDRKNRDRAVAALKGAKGAIDAGTDIWIAPEGTRSETGRVGPFKKGGFHMAEDAEARILPVTIEGTRRVLQAHDWRVKKSHHVSVVIGKPIDAPAYGPERRAELMDAVRAAIVAPLPEALRG
ncbi:MAG: 1-acyl-sn-glycerol-3-phosphate acyltransferase [Myxococcales bacterium]|nr:1-acyl-sn-glycerol-3-phosphate acyltransferase [Myxococcales bacterium]MCB9578543.1 1-acyl-sn-glycerol-3-phosphate acyltransferase [Polyangiaceae bacterium]